MSSDKKVVWVLGAGFSKSLGGPLLGDLLSHRGIRYVQAKFPKIGSALDVYRAYWQHLKGAEESRNQPIYWDHAEEFLEFLSDAAAGSGPRHDILRQLFRDVNGNEPKLSTVLTTAIQCVAAECFFTSHANPKGETWDPYHRWARTLNKNHTIVSFNYDLVLEALGAADNKLKLGHESVVLPTLSNLDEIKAAETVPIVKLHGSVNWHLFQNGVMGVASPDDARERLADLAVPMIAIPGPGKVAQLEKEMRQLWEVAMTALSQANAVVLLGYRFPPSDASARTRILKAVGGSPPHYVRFHTVLGPRIEHAHSVRVMRLLAHTLENAGRTFPSRAHPGESPLKYEGAHHEAHVIQHALYVEDFLSVVHPQLLHGAPWDPGPQAR
jgi:hypothetical protein